MGERDAVPGLIQLLVDPQTDVRAKTAEALVILLGETAASELVKARKR